MRRPIHLSLKQKALILIAVPLAFEVSLLGTLAYLLNESEREAREADRAKSVIAATNTLIENLFDTSITFVLFDVRTYDFMEKRLNKHLEQIPKDMKTVRNLVKSNPKHLQIVDEVYFKTEKSLDWIKSSSAKFKAGEELNVPEALKMRTGLNEIVQQLDQIIKDEHKEQKKNPKAVENLKLILKILLVSGIFISILLAVFLAYVFHLSTTKRLQSLMINSVYLGQGKDLSTPLEGNDEIALIDKTFHAAASALKEAELKRHELERMKQQFVAMISHDLRTPISSVSSTLELLGAQAWGQLNEMGVTKVNNALTSLRHSINLINNLLDLEKMESGTMELELRKIGLLPMIERAGASVATLAETKSIELVLPKNEVEVMGDEFRLTQVLMNLLGNAIKFSPPSTKVQVAIESAENWAKVIVKDQGPGVSAEQDKMLIFERFHQSQDTKDKAREGTGLGLAICKAIIEAHGGSIGVDNNDGAGSCFWFRLKLSDGVG